MPLRMVASTTACACDHYTDRSAIDLVFYCLVFLFCLSVRQSQLLVCPMKMDWTCHLIIYEINSGGQIPFNGDISATIRRLY